jgi:uncharacterized protein
MSASPSRQSALVTGATSGIGLAFAEELSRRGFDLLLVSRSEDELSELARRLAREHGVRADHVALDLSAPDSADRLTAAMGARRIDLLVNNAGFAQYGPFVETDAEVEMRMLNLNIVTLTRLTKLLLPAMVARGSGRILNVASTAGFMPGPLMAVYYASKAYVLSFSEALAEEVRGSGCSVTVLCPGPTRTGFQERARMEESKLVKGRRLLDATEVARRGIEAALAGETVVVPGVANRLQSLVPRIMPRSLLARLVRSAQAPDDA